METKVTVDLILENLQEWVENKQPISVHDWLDAAQKLVVLVSDIQEELFLLEQVISKRKLQYIDDGASVAKADVKVECLDEYVQSRRLTAKIDQVYELIRISKLQARMSDDNLRAN